VRIHKIALFVLAFALGTTPLFSQFGLGQPEKPFPPFKIIGNIYFVGTSALSSFLVTTPEGHILMNSTYERNVPGIKESVEKLGFRFTDIKILVNSHAHGDHMEGDAMVKELSGGAQVVMMDKDVPGAQRIRPGGKTLPIDRIIHDGDTVTLGGTTLHARLTPGHTMGAVTWMWKVTDGGRTYDVLLPPAIAPNANTRLADNKEYPTIMADNEQFYKTMRSLPCDIMLGSHSGFFSMAEKYARLGAAQNPFIDGKDSCLKQVDEWEKLWHTRIEQDKQRIAAGK
jgi:metallo-beta-lactamase class B